MVARWIGCALHSQRSTNQFALHLASFRRRQRSTRTSARLGRYAERVLWELDGGWEVFRVSGIGRRNRKSMGHTRTRQFSVVQTGADAVNNRTYECGYA